MKRILKYEVSFNKVSLPLREVTVNTFPMGIDYNKFHNAAKDHMDQKIKEKSELKKQLELHKKGDDGGKLILSIDRLDYTKGVINRIKAFDVLGPAFIKYDSKIIKIHKYTEGNSNFTYELKDGLLYLDEITPEGKKRMKANDYMRGLQ